MFNCFKIEDVQGLSEIHLGITNIPNVHYQTVLDLADACCCRVEIINPTTIHAQGSFNGIALLESEIIALHSKITFLENCLAKSKE